MNYLELTDIDKEIAIEFGLDAIGFGGNRITPKQLKNAQNKFHALPQDEQDKIVLAYFERLV